MNYPPCSHPGCNNAGETVALFVEPNGGFSQVAVCGQHYEDLRMGCLQPNPSTVKVSSLGNTYEECRLSTILFGNESRGYGLVLKSNTTESLLVSKINYVQACSIYGSVTDAVEEDPRVMPLTYDLFARTISTLGGSLASVAIDGFDRQAACFTACLVVETGYSPTRIKCRDADAVGIAQLAGVPIRVDVAFLGKETNSGTFVFE